MKPTRNLYGIHNDFCGVGGGLRRGCILIRNRDVGVGVGVCVGVGVGVCVCVCVCVGRLKRRKTCFLSYHIAGGHWGSIQSVANEDTVYFLCKRTCFCFNC